MVMGRFIAPDNCPQWKLIVEKGEVCYGGWVCTCSPLERDWRLKVSDEPKKWGGEWENMDYCPFCGKRICKLGLDDDPVYHPHILVGK